MNEKDSFNYIILIAIAYSVGCIMTPGNEGAIFVFDRKLYYGLLFLTSIYIAYLWLISDWSINFKHTPTIKGSNLIINTNISSVKKREITFYKLDVIYAGFPITIGFSHFGKTVEIRRKWGIFGKGTTIENFITISLLKIKNTPVIGFDVSYIDSMKADIIKTSANLITDLPIRSEQAGGHDIPP